MLRLDEYIINLLGGLVHLRIFEFGLYYDFFTKDVHQLIKNVYDRVPHLEYFSMPDLDHYYKRVGGGLVICDEMEHPRF